MNFQAHLVCFGANRPATPMCTFCCMSMIYSFSQLMLNDSPRSWRSFKVLYDIRIVDRFRMCLSAELTWNRSSNGEVLRKTLTEPLYQRLPTVEWTGRKRACTKRFGGIVFFIASRGGGYVSSWISVVSANDRVFAVPCITDSFENIDTSTYLTMLLESSNSIFSSGCEACDAECTWKYGPWAFLSPWNYASEWLCWHWLCWWHHWSEGVIRVHYQAWVSPMFYGARKQASVALSISVSEYYASVMTCPGVLWLSQVFAQWDIRTCSGNHFLSDNQCSINWAVGERCPSCHPKHFDVKINFIWDSVKLRFIIMQ